MSVCSQCKELLTEENKVKKYNRCSQCHKLVEKERHRKYRNENSLKIREYAIKNKSKINESKRMKGLTDDDIKNINFKWEKLMEYTKDWGDFRYEQKYKDEKTPKQKQRLLIIYEKSQQSIPW